MEKTQNKKSGIPRLLELAAESRGEAWDAAAASALVKRVLPEAYLDVYKNPPQTR